MFFTGNWFAAFSLNKGASFTYKSSYADYPQFCCDQVTIHDDARDMFIWLRMGDPAAWNYATNTFRLSVSNVLPFTGAYANYTCSLGPTGSTSPGTCSPGIRGLSAGQ
jgi:hypothetical protein